MNPERNRITGSTTDTGRKIRVSDTIARVAFSQKLKVLACIPARYGSTRFAGKVLAKNTGKFLIQHVYEQACLAKLPQKIIIAADDQKIIDAAKTFGAECVLTSQKHASGTDRIAEAVKNINVDIVVNLQADEPEIDPKNIDYLAELLIKNPSYLMATLAAEFQNAGQITDPNIVKVVVTSLACPEQGRGEHRASAGGSLKACPEGIRRAEGFGDGHRQAALDAATQKRTRDDIGRAIYFSRSPIPYNRETGGIGDVKQYLRHIGIYAYRKDFLLKITKLPQTPLEKIEKLEQLRAIENGFDILVGKVQHTCDGIDTPEQYAEFVKRYRKK